MSRIYDALRVSDSNETSRLAQLIDDSPQMVSSVSQAPPQAAPQSPEPPLAADPKLGAAVALETKFRIVPLRLSAGVPAFPFDGSDTKAAEQYRILRTNLLHHPARPRAVAITSASVGDGKTITAVNLAGILALKSESRVLLIDADLRRSSVAGVLGISNEPGLGDVLRGMPVEDAIVQIEQVPKLHVLPAGSLSSYNPAELLDSAHFRSLFANLREMFSYIIVDTTPMITVADFRIVQEVVDGTAFVLRPNHTSRTALRKALESDSPLKLLGTILNATTNWLFWKSDEDYMYYPSPGKVRE